MEKKQLALASSFATILLTVALAPLSGQQGSNYDPWLDFNGDGKVDAIDLQALGQTYGGLGDSTRDVNVTNFPLDELGNLRVRSRTTKTMALRGTFLNTPYGDVPLLIDQDAPILRSMLDNFTVSPGMISDVWTTLYDARFDHNATSLTGYEIRGQVIAQLYLRIEGNHAASGTVEFNSTVLIEKISSGGNPTPLASYSTIWDDTGDSGFTTTIVKGLIFNLGTPCTVDLNERLSVRMLVSGRSVDLGGFAVIVGLTHYLLSDFQFLIPIVISLSG
jgi:hypothetical protein